MGWLRAIRTLNKANGSDELPFVLHYEHVEFEAVKLTFFKFK